MSNAVVAYVPVIHSGYIDFFARNTGNGEKIYILGEEFIEEFMPLHREIRALDPKRVRFYFGGAFGRSTISVLGRENLNEISRNKVVLPSEEISRKFAAKHLSKVTVEFDDIFLRWDESSVFSQKDPASDRVSNDEFDRRMMKLAEGEADNSSDWWRHVGAVAVVDGTVLFKAHNRHVPSEHMPYIFGDPRDFIQAGTRSDLSTALHGEQGIIVQAAREGVSLEGASIYVTVRPCPLCSKLIAYSGIKKIYFGSGHVNLDGDSVLRSQGVEIIQVI